MKTVYPPTNTVFRGGIIKVTLYDILNDEILFQLYENNNYVVNMGFGVKHF